MGVTKYIFVTGGVLSSLGKGVASASIGCLLESRGLKITMQKIDPYLNVDPGTMSPFQHGEVYVAQDGTEADLDLGHYERFTSLEAAKSNNFTAGQIYHSVISKERRGDYLGKTVQVVPHVTEEIKKFIKKAVKGKELDAAIIELGGTVGDIEGLPFLETIRQLVLEAGPENCVNIHLTLVPYVKSAGEVKTKPTQHSVAKLREIGIVPDIILCRTESALTREAKKKIALFCNVREEAVIEAIDVESIYEIPIRFQEQKLDEMILKKLALQGSSQDMRLWKKNLKKYHRADKKVKIAVAGKYTKLHDSYKSISEALTHAATSLDARAQIEWVETDLLSRDNIKSVMDGSDAILIPGGFGTRGIEGKILAVQYARENKIPFFGICAGMQCAVIEFARNVCGLKDANSTEFDPDTPNPVIHFLPGQVKIKAKGATMRLGSFPCAIEKKTAAAGAYKTALVQERHRHRYEFNMEFKERFIRKGMVFSGLSPDGELLEIMELPGHPWFLSCQFHPEFKSRFGKPHPLFKEFIKHAIG